MALQVTPATRLFNHLTEFPTVRPVQTRAPQAVNEAAAAKGAQRVNGTVATSEAAAPAAASRSINRPPVVPDTVAAAPVPGAARRLLPRGSLVNIVT